MTPSKAQARMIPATQPDPDGGVEMTDAEFATLRGVEATGPELTAAMGRAYAASDAASESVTPPDGVSMEDWLTEHERLAYRHGMAHAAVAAALVVPQMAAAIVDHLNTDTPPGDPETLVCGGCDHVLVTGDPDDDRDPQAEHATHHAELIRAALIGEGS